MDEQDGQDCLCSVLLSFSPSVIWVIFGFAGRNDVQGDVKCLLD